MIALLAGLVAPAAALGLVVGQGQGSPAIVGSRALVAEEGDATVLAAEVLVESGGQYLWILPLPAAPLAVHERMKPLQLDRLLLTGAPRFVADARFRSGCGCDGPFQGDTGDTAALEDWTAAGGRFEPSPVPDARTLGLPLYRFWAEPDARPGGTLGEQTVLAEDFDKWRADVEGQGYVFPAGGAEALASHVAAGGALEVLEIDASDLDAYLVPTEVLVLRLPGVGLTLPYGITALSAGPRVAVELVTVGNQPLAPSGAAPLDSPPGWEVVQPAVAFAAIDARLERFADQHPGALAYVYGAPLRHARDEFPVVFSNFFAQGEAVVDGDDDPLAIVIVDLVSEIFSDLEDLINDIAGPGADKSVDQVLLKLGEDGLLDADYTYAEQPILVFSGRPAGEDLADLALAPAADLEPRVSSVGLADVAPPPAFGWALPWIGLLGWGLRRRR